jgi:hypothetical protein
MKVCPSQFVSEFFVTEEELSIERELITALQLLVSSFTLAHKPSRISVRTAKFGWQTGAVDDGTEGAIEFAVLVLKRAAQHVKKIDPEWKHTLDELIPPERLKRRPKKRPQRLSLPEAELSAFFELRWVAGWLDRTLKGDHSVSVAKAKQRIDDVLLRLEERSSG